LKPSLSEEGVLVGMYSESGDIAIEGDAQGLRALAAALRADKALIELATLSGGIGLYDGYLLEISLETGTGKIRVARSGTQLRVVGNAECKAILADNILELAGAASGSGDHLHVDHYAGHPYLDVSSEPFTVGRSPSP
jgi:hypothetical protein